MDISVIIPIYKAESYIEKCLRSLFTQTKTDGVEFVLVNDATPDASMEIARRVIAEYPHLTVRIFEHTENRNNSAARQTGMDAAVGDYTIQIDSDDWCEPKMLEEMYAKAIETDADIVDCDYFINGKIIKQIECHIGFDVINCIFGKTAYMPTLWNKLIRHSLYLDNNILLDKGELYFEVDRFATIRLSFFADKVAYLSSSYVHYRVDNMLSVVKNRHKYNFKHKANSISLIESFFLENNCAQFNNEILQLKVSSKMVWITENRGERQREVVGHFPEVDRYVLKQSNYHLAIKIPYFLFVNGYVRLANSLFDLRNWANRIRRTKK